MCTFRMRKSEMANVGELTDNTQKKESIKCKIFLHVNLKSAAQLMPFLIVLVRLFLPTTNL